MIFFLAVLIGGLFAWIAVQIGFFATWIMFFNILLGVYGAVFLTPVIVSAIPPSAIEMFGFGHGIILLVVAIASSLTAYGLSYACLSGQLQVEYPKVFDNVGAGLLGFLTGFLVSSFFTFAIALTPISQIESLKPLGLEASQQKTNTSYVCWWCDRIHSLVSFNNARLKSGQEAVDYLLMQRGGAAKGGAMPGPAGPRPGAPAELPHEVATPAPAAPNSGGVPPSDAAIQPPIRDGQPPRDAKTDSAPLEASPRGVKPRSAPAENPFGR